MLRKHGGRKFVFALLIWYTATMVFVLTDKLAGTEFVSIILGTLALHDGSNVYQKKVLND